MTAQPRPRYRLTVAPTILKKHAVEIAAFCLEATQESENPYDMVYEYKPSGELIGRILMQYPGQTKQVENFIRTLTEGKTT